MVTIFWLSETALTGSAQERVATPSMCTVQAPHWAMPQPYFVPVRPICSRIAHKSGVSGSTSTVCTVPFTFSLAMRLPPAPPTGGLGPDYRAGFRRSEEHTSELQSRQYLVCRLLLE